MDTPEQLREHQARMGWKFPLLSDTQGEAVRAYDLLHRVSDEQVVSRPGEFLVDPTGTVRWVDLTEDYRVRARPETLLAAFDRVNAMPR